MHTVAELMVPLDGYTVVDEKASLLDAIRVLETAQAGSGSDPDRPRDRAVLVRDGKGRIVGKLSMWDLLGGLDPGYHHPVDPLVMVESFGLWSHAVLRNLHEKARQVKVGSLLRESHWKKDERIDAEAAMDQAVARLVEGRYQSLIVTRGHDVIGILRLSDVFRAISALMCEAKIASS